MKFTSYIVILLLISYSCSNIPDNFHEIELTNVGVSLIAPKEYIPMNANEYYLRFHKKEYVDKTHTADIIKKLKKLAGTVSAYALIQDSSSYKNSILIYSSPYIKLSQDNFDLLRILSQKQMKQQFAGKGELKTDTFYLSKGNFPYGRTCYSFNFEDKSLVFNEYMVSLPHQLISVLVCNERKDDMEEMIKHIEEIK